jgi:hypothetical protein
MTFEYRVAAKIKKKAESLLRLVFRYVKSSYSAQQHPAPSAKIKVKIRFAGDDHLFFLLVIHILPSTLCQHCFMRGRRHSALRRGESQFHVQLRGCQPEAIPSAVGRAAVHIDDFRIKRTLLLAIDISVELRMRLHYRNGRVRNGRTVAVLTAGKDEYSQ